MAIVTISRGTFSGGSQLAELVGTRLDCPVVSREVVADAAVRYGVSEGKLAKAMEKGPGVWDRFLHDRRRYLAFVQAALCERAAEDRLVYHGSAGHLLLRSVRHVLRVRLIAPLDYRITQLQQTMKVTDDAAIRHIEQVDRQRTRWSRFLYGVDWQDPGLYDLVINLEHLDLEAACETVVLNAERAPFQADDDSRQAMRDLLLASQVRATLAADEFTAQAEVEVRATDAVVEIEAKLADPTLVDAVCDRARAVEGVNEVRYGTRVMLRG